MLDDEQRMVGCAEGFTFRFRQRVEGVRDDRDGEPAALLKFD